MNLRICPVPTAAALALLITAVPCAAELRLEGDQDKVDMLEDMLQTSVGDDVMVEVDSNGNVSLEGEVDNVFGRLLKEVIDSDAVVGITADNEDVDGGHVLIGAYNRGSQNRLGPGNGHQTIDVDDLASLPTEPNDHIITQQSQLIHEIVEAFVGMGAGVGRALNFQEAHRLAIEAENAVLAEQYSMPWRRASRTQQNGRQSVYFFGFQEEPGEDPQIHRTHLVADEDWDLFRVFSRRLSAVFDRLYNNGCDGEFCSLDLDQNTGATSVSLVNTEYDPFCSLSTDGMGSLLGSSLKDDSVVRLDSDGQLARRFAYKGLMRPCGAVYLPGVLKDVVGTAAPLVDGEVYVVSQDTDSIVVFNQKGQPLRHLQPQGLDRPSGITADADGNLFVSSEDNNRILHITPQGEVLRRITHGLLRAPRALAFAITGELYVVSSGKKRILVFNRRGKFKGVLARLRGKVGLSGLALDGPGTLGLFAPDSVSSLLTRIFVTAIKGSKTNIYVYDPDGNRIDRLRDPQLTDPSTIALITEGRP